VPLIRRLLVLARTLLSRPPKSAGPAIGVPQTHSSDCDCVYACALYTQKRSRSQKRRDADRARRSGCLCSGCLW
jgi:hypothetical protein